MICLQYLHAMLYNKRNILQYNNRKLIFLKLTTLYKNISPVEYLDFTFYPL